MTRINYKAVLESGDLAQLIQAIAAKRTQKSCGKGLNAVLAAVESRFSAIAPVPATGPGSLCFYDVDFNLPEMSLRGALNAVVNSKQLATKLNVPHATVLQDIRRNETELKNMSEFGLLHKLFESSGGRPTVSYKLGFDHFTYLAVRSQSPAGRQFASTVVKAFKRLLVFFDQNAGAVNAFRTGTQADLSALPTPSESALMSRVVQLEAEVKTFPAKLLAARKDKEHQALTASIADRVGAKRDRELSVFDAAREIVKSPRSRRNPAGHAGKVTRTVVNTVVQ